VGAVAALAGAAAYVQKRAHEAEVDNPPKGRFVEVDEVRLHYTEQGSGEPLVLLHGNGATVEDFATSGLVDMAAQRYRVITFDRPGYGYSERPRSMIWTPEAQAALFAAAFRQLGIERPIVLGHSWGTQVAVALGLDWAQSVRSLVLLSGYYYPSVRSMWRCYPRRQFLSWVT
jgi:pimeloyl-ACP methyl ester carboxylesterase